MDDREAKETAAVLFSTILAPIRQAMIGLAFTEDQAKRHAKPGVAEDFAELQQSLSDLLGLYESRFDEGCIAKDWQSTGPAERKAFTVIYTLYPEDGLFVDHVEAESPVLAIQAAADERDVDVPDMGPWQDIVVIEGHHYAEEMK